ncbi:hypothetical protein [Nonomuraea longicatena]|uniref:Uncharacterized protein n=1 Tax=Nonomuraea longicatena TaxID=83682 RepID=A0ABN1R7J1_9ACTN
MLFARLSRAAGWHADVEVAGTGWRADTLATHPQTGRKIAWEIQLSPASLATLRRRTETMARDQVATCWISTELTPWLGELPSIQIRHVARENLASAYEVIDGHRRYDADTHSWQNPGPIELGAFVAAVLSGNLVNIPVPRHCAPHFPGLYGPSRRPGSRVWTTPRYAAQFAQRSSG